LDLVTKSLVPPKIESNAKIVEWSDGTYSLAIGDEFFAISKEQLDKTYLFA
jgi:hypothetical protein